MQAGSQSLRTAQLGLEAARHGDDRSLGRRRDVVPAVLVVERDRRAGGCVGDVGAVLVAARAVVLVPGLVDRGLVGVLTGRDRVRALPDLVLRVQRQLGLVAVRRPVGRAAHLTVVVAGHADVGRLHTTGPSPPPPPPGAGASPTTPYEPDTE